MMLYQVGPCPLLEFIESGFKERTQLWRGMGRHGDECTCLVVEDRWGGDCEGCKTTDSRSDTRGRERSRVRGV